MSEAYQCYKCKTIYSKIPSDNTCSRCFNIGETLFRGISYQTLINFFEENEKHTEEIDNSCNFKHCKYFGKNPVYEPCCFCNLRRDLKNCYQEDE